jgi:PadR family transcriptional regulator PadR
MAPVMTQLRRGTLEYCVLALLREDERYAFELVTTLGQADGMVTSEGTLYPLLSRLRKEGLVETRWRESSSGPPRRYYTLTDQGEERLDAFIVEWRRFTRSVDGLLAMGNSV